MLKLCPECGKPVDLGAACCAGGHTFETVDGVVSLFSSERRDELDPYLRDFEQWREDRGDLLNDPSVYPRLPEAPPGGDVGMWKLRKLDLALIRRLLQGRSRQRVLEIGGWNGWLSHQLSEDRHDVVAIDYFVHPFDGLRARKHFPEAGWRAVQMDLEDLTILQGPFDVIIFNHGLGTFIDPVQKVRDATALLASGGMMIATGLTVFKDTSRIEAHFKAVRCEFEEATGRDLFFKPMKGYLDSRDLKDLRDVGLVIRREPRLWRPNLRAVLDPSRPRFMYGVLRRDH